MTPPSLTEQLANLPIIYILYFVVAASIVRLAMLRQPTAGARSIAEFLESAVIAVVLVFLILRPFVVQAYFIPSPSMVPTLLGKNGSGDRILVNKLIYRLGKPNRDDVVVFIPPPLATDGASEETSGVPINFIKRLIAKPGDVLVTHAGRVIVNGTKYSHQSMRDALQRDGFFKSDGDDAGSDDRDIQADHHVKFATDGVYVDGTKMADSDVAKYLTEQPSLPVKVIPGETVLNGQVLSEPFTAEDPDYDLKIYKGESLKSDAQGMRLDDSPLTKEEYDADNAAPAEPLPARKYFMMGDNRNDSKDSTEWGPLDAERIVGKAQVIFWPLNRIRAIGK